MTVAAFYRKHVIDGRAMLRGRGRPPRHFQVEAPAWIVRVVAFGRTTYWLCMRDEIEIQVLDPISDITKLKRENAPHSRAWHHAMQRSADAPLPLSA